MIDYDCPLALCFAPPAPSHMSSSLRFQQHWLLGNVHKQTLLVGSQRVVGMSLKLPVYSGIRGVLGP